MTNILFPAINLMPKQKTLDDYPQVRLARNGVKLYILGALAWDYADTVIDLAATMGLKETAKVARTIRDLRADYDRLRSEDGLDKVHVKREQELAELLETICRPHLDKLCNGLYTEINRKYSPNEEWCMFIQAIQMALTIIDAMKLLAASTDADIKEHGISVRHSMLPDHFKALSGLLPLFTGDEADLDSESRRLTASILHNEIKNIELYDDNGTI